MGHRKAIFSKMMFLDYEKHCCYDDSRWLYSALTDVESIVSNGYWQFFEMIKNLFALALTLAVLVLLEFYKAQKSSSALRIDSMMPALGVLLIVPPSLLVIWSRREVQTDALHQRQDAEAAWVSTFAWLARNGRDLYSLGPRELSMMEEGFDAESKIFVKRHKVVRDISEDSAWVSNWVTAFAYVFMLLWLSFQVRTSLHNGDNLVMVGDLVLILKVYDKFGSYLAKVSSTFVKLQKASVSLKRVADLLNLDNGRLNRLAKMEHPQDSRPDECIQLQDVSLELPAKYDLGRMDRLVMRPVPLKIELGRVVRLCTGSSSQGACLSLMAMASNVLRPTKGSIAYPSQALTVMVPEMPCGVSDKDTLHALQICGIGAELAHKMLAALGLDPTRDYATLSAGDQKMLGLVRAVLRDPDILVLVHPLAFVPTCMHNKIRSLLRVWQAYGGSKILLESLMDKVPEDTDRHMRKRTLIVTSEDMGAEDTSSDMLLDLESLIEPTPGHNFRKVQTNSDLNEMIS